MRKKFTLLLASLFLTLGTAWADNMRFDAKSTPALPGTKENNQYTWKSSEMTAPDGFTTLRLTFLENVGEGKDAGDFPHVALAEFYLYDKDGQPVTLTEALLSSNATETNEGNSGIDKLCDGNTTQQEGEGQYDWYWHSYWSANAGAHHYLEINVAGIANLSTFAVGYVSRQSDGTPTEILVTTGSSTADVAAQYNSYMLVSKYDLSTQAFRIKNSNITNEERFLTIETPNLNNRDEDGVKILPKSSGDESEAQAWKFILQDDGTYRIQSASGYFLNNHGGWGINAEDGTQGHELDNPKFTLEYLKDGEFRIKSASGYVGPNDPYATGNHPYEVFGNHTTNNRYLDWILEPYTNEYVVTYNYKVGDKVVLSDEYIIAANAEYPAVKTFYGVTIAGTAPTGNVTENATFDFTCTVEDSKFPFTYVADVASITSWQYIQMHSNNKQYLKYESSYIAWADAQPAALGKKDAYAWAFVGNPFVGFKMVNKAATKDKALKSNNSGNPAMADYADATAFFAAASDVSGAQYFCMQYPGGNYLNAQNGKVAHWDDNDAGSTMNVLPCPEYTLEDYKTDLNILVTNAETFVNDNDANKNKLGYYTVTDVQTQLDDAKKCTDSKSFDEVDAAFVALQNVLNNPAVNFPVAGKFYRIKGKASEKYMSTPLSTDAANRVKMRLSENPDDAGCIFYLTAKNKLLSYKLGTFLQNTHDINALGESNGNTVYFNKSESNNLGFFTLKTDFSGSKYIYDDKNETEVDRNGSYAANNCEWTVEEVTTLPVNLATIGGNSWATLYAPVALSIPTGVTAYTGTGTLKDDNNNTWLTLTPVVGGVIPAETAVILKGSQGGAHNFTKTTTETTIDGNVLAGTVATKVAPKDEGTIYTLQREQEKDENGNVVGYLNSVVFGIYANEDNSVPNLNGFRAYLPLNETSANSISIRFEGTTDIEHSEIRNQHSEMIFDLLGRRVEAITKGGIYIVNGKKVVVK